MAMTPDVLRRDPHSDHLASVLADPFFAEALFDQLPDVVFFVKDTSGRYLVANTTLLQRCGLQHKHDLIGRSPLDVFSAELGRGYIAQDQYVIQTGHAIHDRLELHLYPNGAAGWCLTHKIPLFDRDGEVVGLAGISRDLPMPNTHHPVYRRIAAAMEYMHTHYADPLKLDDLAGIAQLSVAQFERHIRRIFGLTPKQLIIKTRIEAAMHLLADDDTIAEVAVACGYSDHSAFARQFKAAVGLSPTAYRALLRFDSAHTMKADGTGAR